MSRFLVIADAAAERTSSYWLTDQQVLAIIAGLIWIAVSFALAAHVRQLATRGKKEERLWTVLTLLLGVIGYVGYRVHSDSRSRRMKAAPFAAISMVLMAWAVVLPVIMLVDYRTVLPWTLFYNQSFTVKRTVPPGGLADLWTMRQRFDKLREEVAQGKLPAEEFRAQAESMQAKGPDASVWRRDPDTGDWQKRIDDAWVSAPLPHTWEFETSWPWYLLVAGPIINFLGPWMLFIALYVFLRSPLTIEKIRRRLDEGGQLVETDGVLLRVEGLKKHFPVKRGVFSSVVGHVKAVDGVSFKVEPGKTLGLVGESGCGKTTAGRMVLNLLKPTAGRVIFDGIDLSLLSPGEMRVMRRRMQLIFQDPFGSLNPRMTVLSIVGEALAIHGVARGRERTRMVEELLEKVGLDRRHVRRYPHEFSGGQRQRIGIARALALNPGFIVCDEPVSALDVSIQAQIINLLRDLQKEMGLAYLFIAHDLSVVEHISDDVAVMYLGHIVENAPSKDLYARPLHPYTMALMSAVPVPDPTRAKHEIILEGGVPSPLNPPVGCVFHTRCRYMTEACKAAIPELREIEPGHFAACIRVQEILAGAKPAS